MVEASDFRAVRAALASMHGDISNDAVGSHAPKVEDMYAPEAHASALDPANSIVLGSRGSGKSFWSGVLGQEGTKAAAAIAYPSLGLEKVGVEFGFTGGVGGADGVSVDALNANVSQDAGPELAKAFWWATILRACYRSSGVKPPSFRELTQLALDWEEREALLTSHEERLRRNKQTLLVVYDALDTVATSWSRRRLLTEALFEVIWATRAYRSIKTKLFVRTDQLDDDELKYVELPKLRTGAVRLVWEGQDLYGLLFARLALSASRSQRTAFGTLLASVGAPIADRDTVLTRKWPLIDSADHQTRLMTTFAGRFMADGPNGFKKGRTYDWPLTHLADGFNEVTPRSFLGLMIAAASFGPPPVDRVITPEGIRHGLREASRTRVDQLHQEFPWIKGVLAPLAGLLLPQHEAQVFRAWKLTKTLKAVATDAAQNNYLPPFATEKQTNENALFEALRRIGVMFRRRDDRLDMPDLFRVAAKLLKKGGTTPL